MKVTGSCIIHKRCTVRLTLSARKMTKGGLRSVKIVTAEKRPDWFDPIKRFKSRTSATMYKVTVP